MEAILSTLTIKNRQEQRKPGTEGIMTAEAIGPGGRAALLFGVCSFLYSTTSVYLSLFMTGPSGAEAGAAASPSEYYLREAAALFGFLFFALQGVVFRDRDRNLSRSGKSNTQCLSRWVLPAGAVLLYEGGLLCSLHPGGQSLLIPACICIAAAGYLMGQVCLTAALLLKESGHRGRMISLGVVLAYTAQFLLNLNSFSQFFLLLLLAAGMPLLVLMTYRQGNVPDQAVRKMQDQDTDPDPDRQAASQAKAGQELILTSILTAVFVFLLCYYDRFAVSMAASGSSAVYGWPRLLIPAGAVVAGTAADKKSGRMLPLVTALISLTMVLVPFLTRTESVPGEMAGMSLFYFFLGAVMVFYYASFWKLAFRTANPSFRVIQGRLIEKTVTIVSSLLLAMLTSPIGIAAIYLAAVAFSIILSVTLLVQKLRAAETETASVPETESGAEDRMDLFCEKYALTKREREVLERLLVSDESVQEMADALFISKRVLQRHTEALYDKTGCRTRIGLINLYYRGE